MPDTARFLKDVTYHGFNPYSRLVADAKQAPVNNGNGYLEGYLAVFGNIDHGRDLIKKGAFAKTIKERVAAGKVPLMAVHAGTGGSTTDVVGIITEAREDDHGLFIHAEFSSTPLAQEVRTLVAEGMVKGLSIGYQVIDYEIVDPASGGLQDSSMPQPVESGSSYPSQEAYVILKELRLMEGTVTPFPMNEEATITKVKSRTTSETASPEGTEGVSASKETSRTSPSIAYYESLVLLTKSAFLLERSR